MVLYNSPPEAMAFMANATEEQKAEGMKPWAAWMEQCGDSLVDGGAPLAQGMAFTSSDCTDCSGAVSGYSVLKADSMDDACKLVKDHPHLNWMDGCSLQLFETAPM